MSEDQLAESERTRIMWSPGSPPFFRDRHVEEAGMSFDTTYRDRAFKLILDAVHAEFKNPASQRTELHAAEIIDACAAVLAVMMAPSPGAATPEDLSANADRVRTNLIEKVPALQQRGYPKNATSVHRSKGH